MKNLLTVALVWLCSVISLSAGDFIPVGETFLRQLTPRDSILVADQLEYGFELDSVRAGTSLALQDFAEVSNDTLTLVRNWQIDTVKVKSPGRKRFARSADTLYNVRGSIIIAPFEEGIYDLPPIAVKRTVGGVDDTLVFSPQQIDVKTIAVDTATFEFHGIKGQARYPVTLNELLPYMAGFVAFAVLVILAVCLILLRRDRPDDAPKYQEPAYIVALRSLDGFRGERYWAPDKQKTMYSGITDALRTYMESRFDINAEEMTTQEIFSALKDCDEIPQEIYSEAKNLFELSDYVKFAKLVASDEDNARAVPAAVRFVTSTYQSQMDEQAANDGEEAVKE